MCTWKLILSHPAKLSCCARSTPNLYYFGLWISADEATYPLAGLDLAALMTNMEDPTYFRYKGGLTTPPCFESVIWTIFMEPIKISESQVYQILFFL